MLIQGYELYGYEIEYFNETKNIPLQGGTSIRIHTSEYLDWLYTRIDRLKEMLYANMHVRNKYQYMTKEGFEEYLTKKFKGEY